MHREEQEDETTWERVQGAWKAATKKLSDWGILSPRLMLAGGGLFMTLSNWGLLPPVGFWPLRACHSVVDLPGIPVLFSAVAAHPD